MDRGGRLESVCVAHVRRDFGTCCCGGVVGSVVCGGLSAMFE